MEDILVPQNNVKVMLFAMAVLAFFLLLFVAFIIGWRISQRPVSVSPYSGLPLRRASDLSYLSKEKVFNFLHSMHQYDNRVFRFNKAALCRETGRLFPDCVTWYDTIHLDWSFIQKRYPGNYVSWGSLTHAQQEAIRKCHETLWGYQTEYSCSTPSPRLIDPDYAYTRPGPLYVDINTNVLLGWKNVPDTELEVLVVQKPKQVNY